MKSIAILFLIISPAAFKVDDSFYKELAYRYAPIHYQDTDNTDAKADYLTRFDYDQNFAGTDNWEHLNSGDLSAYVYYSVVETATHWFIVYGFFHPRDWADNLFDQGHENDLEGTLSIIRKDGSTWGIMDGMITVFHNDFYSYTAVNSPLTNGKEDIDGILTFQSFDGQLHPKTCQEAKGHGIKAWPYAGNFSGKSDQDGIIYYPSKTTAQVPSSGNDRSVSYQLIDLNAIGNLWTMQLIESIRSQSQSTTFASWGTFKGDCNAVTSICSTNAANAPWGWDDSDDGPNYAGELAFDPAAIVDYYFNGLGSFGRQYQRNKYLEELKKQAFDENFLPNGWPKQVKLKELYNRLD